MGKYIRHLIAAAVAFIVGAVVAATGIEPNPEQVQTVTDGLASGVTEFVMLVVYAFLEKFLKRFPMIDLEGFLDRGFLRREAGREQA